MVPLFMLIICQDGWGYNVHGISCDEFADEEQPFWRFSSEGGEQMSEFPQMTQLV